MGFLLYFLQYADPYRLDEYFGNNLIPQSAGMGKNAAHSSDLRMGVTDLAIEKAFGYLQRGELDAAEGFLIPLLEEATALHLMGVLRVRQARIPEAAEFLARSVALNPGEAQAQFNLGKVLAALGRTDEAETALRVALSLDCAHLDAARALARLLHGTEQFAKAAAAWRSVLKLQPREDATRLALTEALLRGGMAGEAEGELNRALAAAQAAPQRANLHQALAQACGDRPEEALSHLESAQSLDPSRTDLDGARATLLEKLHRFAEARQTYEAMLARDPANAALHGAYNDLLYRLGADATFLSSYNDAPPSAELLLQKGRFLLAAERGAEAETVYGDILAAEPDNPEAALGLGLAQLKQGGVAAAVSSLERAAARHPDASDIWCNLAGALIQQRDAQKAEAMAMRSLTLEPDNQIAIAALGTSWRLMGDARDEWLNRYDDFIQIYDLEPPEGFANMCEFNAALNASLDRMHPHLREYLRQSLRGGSQTSASLFGGGHLLVEKLRSRIAQAVERHIARLEKDHEHPLLSRKGESWKFGGSWSSRLRDQGFHINHVHPGGWISSCYYVDLPPAVENPHRKEGWITFGEPSFETPLASRRTIQPRAGQLVLFPSYMWHGTTPFRDRHARTTIAFDLIPA